MVRRGVITLLGMLLVLAVSACGRADTGSGASGAAGASATTPAATATVDHSGMQMDMSATSTATMDGMMEMGSAPFDAQFIDSMIEHHRGAISMAEQALTESEREEIKQLAQNIITSQQQEVEQMTAWRQQWYPDLETTGGMGMDMGEMELDADTGKPFDQRFITAMIAHHSGAISMAREALTKAERAEIKQLAQTIITAQEAEVQQLQTWNTQWFGGQ